MGSNQTASDVVKLHENESPESNMKTLTNTTIIQYELRKAIGAKKEAKFKLRNFPFAKIKIYFLTKTSIVRLK